MRAATRLAFLLALLLLCRDGFPQVDLTDDLVAESPFRLNVDPARTGFLPDASAAQIAIVLDIPKDHKVYRDSVKLSLPATAGVTVRGVSISGGITEHDSFADGTTTVLKERSELTMWVSLDPVPTEPLLLKPVVELQGCSDRVCFLPEKRTVDVTLPPPGQGPAIKPPPELAPGAGTREESAFQRILRESGLTVAMLAAFGWGVLVSLTPCVWPLIPVVLAVVGATAEGADWKRGLRLSLLYAAGLAVTFGTIGGLIAFAARAAGVTGFLQSPWVVGFVCAFFVAL
ncbi:MAG TPA: protein-disulfide reductase DsbD domain-containing protein, partial [Planctomycetota bacterium]|nr:protein-disulfide reductase DsbD domain-containing protein [Planctomycetota bacterium]